MIRLHMPLQAPHDKCPIDIAPEYVVAVIPCEGGEPRETDTYPGANTIVQTTARTFYVLERHEVVTDAVRLARLGGNR